MADFEYLRGWLQLSDNDKLTCFRAITDKYDLKMPTVEKDWWVIHTLAIIFSTPYSKSLIFKGGTAYLDIDNLTNILGIKNGNF